MYSVVQTKRTRAAAVVRPEAFTSSLSVVDFSEGLSWASQAQSGSVAAGQKEPSLSVLVGKLEALWDSQFMALLTRLLGSGEESSA